MLDDVTSGAITPSSTCYLTSLTRSSMATFRLFQTNSHTAITQAIPIPPISTTNTPPTFANPSSFAVELLFEISSCWHNRHLFFFFLFSFLFQEFIEFFYNRVYIYYRSKGENGERRRGGESLVVEEREKIRFLKNNREKHGIPEKYRRDFFFLLLKTNRATLLFKSLRDDLQRKIRGEIFFFLLHSSNNRYNEFHFKSFYPKTSLVGFRGEILDDSRGNSSGIIQIEVHRNIEVMI